MPEGLRIRPAGARACRRGGLVGRAAALLAATAMGAVLTGCAAGASDGVGGPVARVESSDAGPLQGALLDEPYTLAEATLTDTDDRPFEVAGGLDRPVTMLFFGYTACPDICPATMANIAAALGRLDPEVADQVQVWFVTTDPVRDRPAVLRDYLDRFDPGFVGLTAPLDDVVALAASVHVPVEQGRRLPSGGREVSHGTPILAVTPDREVPVVWTEGTSPAALAADLDTIVRDGVPAPADADQEGQS